MFDIVLAMERLHLVHTCPMGLKDVQFLVEAVPKHELVRHLHAQGFHRVPWSVVNGTHTGVVEVVHLLGHMSKYIFIIN